MLICVVYIFKAMGILQLTLGVVHLVWSTWCGPPLLNYNTQKKYQLKQHQQRKKQNLKQEQNYFITTIGIGLTC